VSVLPIQIPSLTPNFRKIPADSAGLTHRQTPLFVPESRGFAPILRHALEAGRLYAYARKMTLRHSGILYPFLM
jgi:hypothetical protein